MWERGDSGEVGNENEGKVGQELSIMGDCSKSEGVLSLVRVFCLLSFLFWLIFFHFCCGCGGQKFRRAMLVVGGIIYYRHGFLEFFYSWGWSSKFCKRVIVLWGVNCFQL
jgi:hypothetical protein